MWFLPSYNRPEKCKEVLQQIRRVGCSTPGLLFVNGGDHEPYKELELPDNWTIQFSDTNLGVCGAMNWCFNSYPDEAFYGLICDDEYVYTPEWDKKLIMAAGKTRISHGNDGWQSKQRIHAYATYGGDIVRACGWWAPPGLWHWFFDDVWELIAKDFKFRRFVPEVKCEHKHYLAQKSEKDETYEAGESKKDSDQANYNKFMNEIYPALKENLKQKFRYHGN